MKKSIEFNLSQDKEKLYEVEMFHDNKLVKKENVTAEEMKNYMSSKLENDELSKLRKITSIMKVKKIKLNLKE